MIVTAMVMAMMVTTPKRMPTQWRLAAAKSAGVPAHAVGATGGSRIVVTVAGRPAIDCEVGEAERVWSDAIGRHMAPREA